ncbi:MAG: hypothetical protein PUI85_01590 [Eubacteriales bacterium]|nr:hypothetical protein [Eubacteriales bacterium]MDY3332916.1 hypothetical protein [Gallibacter sp.]
MLYNFELAIKNNSLAHAFIIESINSELFLDIAKDFQRKILCETAVGQGCNTCAICSKINNNNNVDFYFVEPTKEGTSKNISIKDNDIKKLQENIYLSPLDFKKKIFVISQAELITFKAFNRLLKTLEEPPLDTIILLITNNALKLPETIRSRCIYLNDSIFADIISKKNKFNEQAEIFINLILNNGYYYEKKSILDNCCKTAQEANLFIDSLEIILRDKILMKNDSQQVNGEYINLIYNLEKIRIEIFKNARPVYAFKKIVL